MLNLDNLIEADGKYDDLDEELAVKHTTHSKYHYLFDLSLEELQSLAEKAGLPKLTNRAVLVQRLLEQFLKTS